MDRPDRVDPRAARLERASDFFFRAVLVLGVLGVLGCSSPSDSENSSPSSPGSDSGTGGATADGGPSGADASAGGKDWRLGAGHYEKQWDLIAVYPRPDDEISTANARHRNAYEGMRYEIPIGVMYGAWPFKYELSDDDGASWLSIEHETLEYNAVTGFWDTPDGYGVLSGTAPSSGGPWTPTVTVTDQNGDTVTLSWTITLMTAAAPGPFRFMNPSTGNDTTGDGSRSAPFASPVPFYDAAHDGAIVVIEAGTTYKMDWKTNDEGSGLSIGGADQPIAWISSDRSDPVIIDGSDSEGTAGTSWSVGAISSPDGFLWGLHVQDLGQTAASLPGNQRAWVLYAHGATRFTAGYVSADNPSSGSVGTDNESLFYTPSAAAWRPYQFYFRCAISNARASQNSWTLFTNYTTRYFLVEQCTTPLDRSWNAMFVKGAQRNTCVRNNLGRIGIYNASTGGVVGEEEFWNAGIEVSYHRGTYRAGLGSGSLASNARDGFMLFRSSLTQVYNQPGQPDLSECRNVIYDGDDFMNVYNAGAGAVPNPWASTEGSVALDDADNVFDSNYDVSTPHTSEADGTKGAQVK